MRADVVLIALSLALLVMAIVCVCCLRTTAMELMEQARTARDLLPHDPERAAQEVDALFRRWTQVEKRWQFLSIHEDLMEVTLAVTEARDALDCGDADAACMALSRTMIALDAVLHKELPTPGNIF